MSTHRHLRIIAVLVGVKGALGIVPLATAVNKRFTRAYPPSLISTDLKALIGRNLVKITDTKAFSVTDQGKAHFQSLPPAEVIALCEALVPA